jgi:hypothetical protein
MVPLPLPDAKAVPESEKKHGQLLLARACLHSAGVALGGQYMVGASMRQLSKVTG